MDEMVVNQFGQKKVMVGIKRGFDVVSSLIALIILSPLLLIIAVLVKVTSPGPILFKQNRIGKDGKFFKMLKFRTMVDGAEKLGDGIRIASENDPRILNIGRILRKTSLDELPQLLNVLSGSMSIVGPRPPVTYHPYDGYENYPEWAKNRFAVRPGITGLAQVELRNSIAWEGRFRFDIQYIENFNLFLDIRIILLTIRKVIWPDKLYLDIQPSESAREKETTLKT